MLLALSIRDFVLIGALDLEFGPGFGVLTGETGAGKTILFDALALALGARADSTTVRHGAEKAQVVAEFALPSDPSLRSWLAEREIDVNDSLLLRRSVDRNGRSHAFVNDQRVSANSLRELGRQLVEIHGQHEQQRLLTPADQLAFLDRFGSSQNLLNETARLAERHREITRALADLESESALSEAELHMLKTQLEELEEHAVHADELAEMETEHERLAHAEELLEVAHRALEALEDEHGSLSTLASTAQSLRSASSMDSKLVASCELLEQAQIQLEEARNELSHYTQGFSHDPSRYQSLDQALQHIYRLARRHRIDPQNLHDEKERIEHRLALSEGAEQRKDALQNELARIEAGYQQAAVRLREHRQSTATKLAEAVTARLAELRMADRAFAVQFDALSGAPRRQGMDRVQFVLTTRGEELARPISKVASGGELSRIGLALRTVLIGSEDPAVILFDEVDAGIGGETAGAVARQIKALAAQRQIFCITHLPQIASVATQHFQVSKVESAEQVTTKIEKLDSERRIAELARMLGGDSGVARAHAEELLGLAEPG